MPACALHCLTAELCGSSSSRSWCPARCARVPARIGNPATSRRRHVTLHSGSSGDGGPTMDDEPPQQPRHMEAVQTPSLQDGINWYCYCTLGLLFLTDFTPLGALLTSSGSSSALNLALFQWLVFVLPSLWTASSRGWDLRETFRLRGCAPGWALAGAAAGPLLWATVATAISLRTGTPLWGGAEGAAAVQQGLDSSLLGSLTSPLGSPSEWAGLLGTAALSPAVAEELLFRGLLLTALQSRLGSVDSAALCGALFAAIHLSVEQFFPLAVLGIAAGAATVASGSLLPAVALHFGHNAAALVAGALLHSK